MSEQRPSASGIAETTDSGRRRRKRLRRIWRGTVIVFVTLTVAWVVLTRTPVTKALILPRIAEATGLDLDASSVVIAPDLRVVIRDAVVRIEGAPGLASEFARINRLDATIDWSSLFAGRGGGLARVDVYGPRIRVSQDQDTGKLTVSALRFKSDGSGGDLLSKLPLVTVRNLSLEVGEHDLSGYWKLAAVQGSGEMLRSTETEDHRYILRFDLHPENEPENAAQAVGRLDERGLELTLTGMAVEAWEPSDLPSKMRSVFDRLAIRGDVRPSRISVTPDGSLAVELALDGVALNVPGTELGTGPMGERVEQEPLRLTGVTGLLAIDDGNLSADIRGNADRLRYRVRFDTLGLSADTAPFVVRLDADPFRLENDLELLRFVPKVVNEKLALFGQPTADVRAEVWIARGPMLLPEQRRSTGSDPVPETLAKSVVDSDEIKLVGVLRVSDGTAAYRGFPYVIRGMTGTFEFNRDELKIVSVEGYGRTGAHLTAQGTIAPMGKTAEVNLKVRIENAPVDEELNAGLSPGRRKIVAELFDQEGLKELVRQGLVLDAKTSDELEAQAKRLRVEREGWAGPGAATQVERDRIDALLAEIDSKLARAPAFRLGGTFDADITVHRAYAERSIWTRDIHAIVHDAGLLTSQFPMPLVSDALHVHITDEFAKVQPSELHPIRGEGDVTLSATLDLEAESDTPPVVTIDASGVEINDLLLHAVSQVGRQRLSVDAAQTLSKLDLDGTLGCEARFEPGEDGNLQYRVDVAIERADATPRRQREQDEPRLKLADVRGEVHIRRDMADIDLTAQVGKVGGERTPTPVAINASLRAAPGVEGVDLDAKITAHDGDASLPVHQAIWVFAPELATRVAALHDQFQPEGTVDVDALISGRMHPENFEPELVSVKSSKLRELLATTPYGRIEFRDATGEIGIISTGQPMIEARGFEAQILDEPKAGGTRAPMGDIALEGWLPLGAYQGWPLETQLGVPALAAKLTDARIETRFVSNLLHAKFSERSHPLLDELDLAGEFDADLLLTPPPLPEGGSDQGPGDTPAQAARAFLVSGRLTPRGMRFTKGGRRVSLTDMSGSVALDPEGGRFQDLQGVGDHWSVDTDGVWETTPEGAFRLSADWAIETEGVQLDPLAVLPDTVRDAILALEPVSEGRLSIRQGKLFWGRETPDVDPTVTASGMLYADDLAMKMGVPITAFKGEIGFDTWAGVDPESGQESTPYGFRIGIDGERLRVMGLRVQNVQANAQSGQTRGTVLIPEFAADSHGGRVTGSVHVGEPQPRKEGEDPSMPAPRPYALTLDLANVRLAPVLEDIRVSADETLADAAGLDPTVWDRGVDRTRGTLTARISLSGIVGRDEGRRGRGEARASGGSVLAVPLLVPLLEFSNLQPPLGANFDLAQLRFYIQDDRLTFEHLGIYAGTVELLGFGSMTWPGGELDLRFASKTGRRWPVISDLIEGVRDELLTTKVTGHLSDPELSAETLPTTRRLLSAILGKEESAEDRRLRDIEAEARSAKARFRRADNEESERVFSPSKPGG